MLRDYLLSPLDGCRAAVLDDFKRCHYGFAVEAAFHDDIDFPVGIQRGVMEELRLRYGHARLSPVLPHEVHNHLECRRALRHRSMLRAFDPTDWGFVPVRAWCEFSTYVGWHRRVAGSPVAAIGGAGSGTRCRWRVPHRPPAPAAGATSGPAGAGNGGARRSPGAAGAAGRSARVVVALPGAARRARARGIWALRAQAREACTLHLARGDCPATTPQKSHHARGWSFAHST